MLGWLVRGLLITAGFIASWFVANDAPQFVLLQMAIAVMLVVLLVWILAFWPERWTQVLRRVHNPR